MFPKSVCLGLPPLDPVFVTDPIEDVMKRIFMVGMIGELDTVRVSVELFLSRLVALHVWQAVDAFASITPTNGATRLIAVETDARMIVTDAGWLVEAHTGNRPEAAKCACRTRR